MTGVQTCALPISVGGSSTCANSKLGTPGGSGSYLADAIRSAHDFLNANGRSGATKAIVIFSDGGFQSSYAPNTNYGSAATSTNGSMSAKQCQAAIAAALNAKNAGITIYTLAYNASTSSSGCNDSTALTKGSGTASDAWTNNTSPCSVMRKVASSDSYFFSNDKSGSCKNTTVTANNVSTSNSKIGRAHV